MNYYRIKPLLNTYGWFEFDYQKMLKVLGRKTFSSFTRTDGSLAENWQDFEGRFEAPDGEIVIGEKADVISWSSLPHLVLNQRAFKVLEPLLAPYGEFLDAPSEGHPYKVFNCRTTRQADPIHSEKLLEDELQMGLKSLTFDPETINKAPIFKTDFDLFQSLFCDEIFKDAVESNNLKGLEFRKDLATSPLR